MIVGLTVVEPCGSAHGLHTLLPALSATESDVAVPLLTCQASVAEVPAVTVVGETVRLNVNGTVTVTVCGADVPPGPVAVIEKVVVLLIGVTDDPEVASWVSSVCCTGGVIVTDVAFVVAHVMVDGSPALTNIGLAVNDVTCGGAGCATCTVTVCGALLTCSPEATAE